MKRIMKKVAVLFLLACSFSCILFADDLNGNMADNSMKLSMDIPEDYGIDVPLNVLQLDHFVFRYDFGDRASLVPNDTLVINYDMLNARRMEFTLLFYGNLSSDYHVMIETDTGLGWTRTIDGEQIAIPLEVEWSVNEDARPEMSVNADLLDTDNVELNVPALGPMVGEPVVDVAFEWSDDAEMVPGAYFATINFTLSAI